MESKYKCDVTQLTKRYCRVGLIKREEDKEGGRGEAGDKML